ncbi:putative cytochrome c [Emiliania huxleyi CCMP1516]|uniref:Cytochrome c domain-containing protein n=2 Tax=Emiliania huxleyi TaxID=2903 RepID=A0A0D3KI42_EMIH1|nr:putative cytochrome c [Emiliania huxleyi CCMP1516]EOD35427.1 putative cytochrome c [Emiliania huxleyi CCMP1516]|mmetsp:Transcript_885/g.2621  ORF Transcript_885/g.2621 Transcript_885/m.2621 type:complete len:207 (-) Transcript_885:152-772(-)|eukprot:XP_005787856.1 putative cytochrome c [Emiliania huxleyi CCMP1516]
MGGVVSAAASGATGIGQDTEALIRARQARMRQEVLLAKLHDEARLHASQEWDKENGESQPAAAPPAASKPKKKKKTEKPPDKAAKAPETTAKDAPAVASAPAEPADTARGATLFKAKCAACHTCNEGGPSKQGPNLYSIIGAQTAHDKAYKYTKAMSSFNSTWTEETMLSFLAKPKEVVKGTSMAFPGFKKEKDRVDVVAYLSTLK